MKLMKKMTAAFAVLCMTVCMTMTAFAADSKLMFTDPETTVGETVEVKGVVEVDSAYGLEDMTINLKYDTSMLKFVSAEEVTESETEPGVLTFSRIGIENSYRVEYIMYFEALAEGTAAIEVIDCNIWTTTDEKLYPVLGNSKVTIAAGEAPATDVPADEPADEPSGAEDVVINISSTTSITLLTDISDITLPTRYLATTIKVNDVEFPAWQDTEKTNLCILYALNSNGENALYQYDVKEGTYQRFEVPTVEGEQEKQGFASIVDSIGNVFEDNMDYVVIGVGAGFLLFVIIILVLSIKLYNRNAELDELYEEYGLYEEEEEKEAKAVKEVKKAEEPTKQKVVKVIPVTKKDKAEFIDIKEVTEDDIVITSDDDLNLEEEIPEIQLIEEEPVPEMKKGAEKETSEQKDDEEDEYYDDDMDLDFEIDFIDLDD